MKGGEAYGILLSDLISEKGGLYMPKAIVHKVSDEIKAQSIETLKVRKDTLAYLRKNGFNTIKDFVDRQAEVPSKYKGNIYAYLIFGIEDID